jgi:hypothetical protein
MVTAKKRIQQSIVSKPKLAIDKRQLGFHKVTYFDRHTREDEIKGFVFHGVRKISDRNGYLIKINPLDIRYKRENHASLQEAVILTQLQEDLNTRTTPHITRAFWVDTLPNNCKSLTFVPLKQLHNRVYRDSSVIIAEFVKTGSLTDFLEYNEITLKQWKYIIFGIVWTLAVLQDKYEFVHADLHSSNILIEKCSESKLKYQWYDSDGLLMEFNTCGGLLPKFWDFEFSSFFNPPTGCEVHAPNLFGVNQDSMPQKFDPYYDLHEFFMSILYLNCPDEIRDFITSLYPDELIANSPTCSLSSLPNSVYSNDSTAISEWSIEPRNMFYETDEDVSNFDENESWDSEKTETTDESSVDSRNIFVTQGRLRNDVIDKYFLQENIPTPFSLLSHPFFDEYRVQIGASDMVFTHTEKSELNASG